MKSLIIHENINSLNYFFRQTAAAQLILNGRQCCVFTVEQRYSSLSLNVRERIGFMNICF